MDELYYLLKGIIIGVIMVSPVGPITFLLIERGLKYGFKHAAVSGFGVALADGIYAFSAGFSVAFLSVFLEEYRLLLQLIGGFMMLLLGSKIFLDARKSHTKKLNTTPLDLIKDFTSAFLLTIVNPLTVAIFAVVFLGMGVGLEAGSNTATIVAFALGIFIGSFIWQLFISSTTAWLKDHLTPNIIKRTSQTAGILIMLFGTYGLIQTLYS